MPVLGRLLLGNSIDFCNSIAVQALTQRGQRRCVMRAIAFTHKLQTSAITHLADCLHDQKQLVYYFITHPRASVPGMAWRCISFEGRQSANIVSEARICAIKCAVRVFLAMWPLRPGVRYKFKQTLCYFICRHASQLFGNNYRRPHSFKF